MTFVAKPKAHHPDLPRNALGLTRRDYEGAVSTLCAGCGHDSVSAAIVQACHELSIPAHRVAKLSGIGCSSKTPTYFLGRSHGFNSVHGRMPSVVTGASMANRDLCYIGVSGDGDSASIGLGQFAHIARRRINMTYIVDNNGTYGLTKGQFSATNDKGSTSKKGVPNVHEPIDLCMMAIQLGATFVARSFSGDKTQLVPLLKAALLHEGFAFLDVISPCVAFNNHEGSTKSYSYVRGHSDEVAAADLIPVQEEMRIDYAEGSAEDVRMPDGSTLRLRKLHRGPSGYYDPHDRAGAMEAIMRLAAEGEIVTGLLYLDAAPTHCHDILGTVATPLNALGEAELVPDSAQLAAVNASFR